MENKTPDELIVRFLTHEASAEEREEFLNWLAGDPGNHRLFQEYLEVWEKNAVPKTRFQMKPALDQLNTRINKSEKESRLKVVRWLSIAATLAAFVIVGTWALKLTIITESVQDTVVTTGGGERKTVILPDHSIVTLNSGSSLIYPTAFSGKTRSVRLQGEAFFNINRDLERPFIVQTGKIQTKVLGTSFNINSAKAATIVTVVTGRVQVSLGNHTTQLVPNQKAVCSHTNNTISKEVADTEFETGWTAGKIIFRDTPLKTVCERLEEWYGVEIEIEEAGSMACRITGTFQNKSLSHILESICFTTGLRAELRDKKVWMKGKTCN